jgi:hypothetical protein
MALTSGDYEAQANRLRSRMGQTVDELRSNLTGRQSHVTAMPATLFHSRALS